MDAVGGILRRCPLPGPGIKHRQCGQGLWYTIAVASHGPQLTAVIMDGVMVIKLEPEHGRLQRDEREKKKSEKKCSVEEKREKNKGFYHRVRTDIQTNK